MELPCPYFNRLELCPSLAGAHYAASTSGNRRTRDGIARLRRACSADGGKSDVNDAAVDNEHLFGFTEGTDIGAAGEKEMEVEFDRSFGQGHRLLHRLGIGIRVQIHSVPEFPDLGGSDVRLL